MVEINKFEVIMGLVNLIKGVAAASRVRGIQQVLLDIADCTDELTQNLTKALYAVLFDDDYQTASNIVKDNILSLLDGSGNMYYDPNLIVTVMLPSDLKDIMLDFFLEPDTDIDLLADKVSKEYGAEAFRKAFFEGLLEWTPFYSFAYIEKYREYLSDEEIAKLTIDRYKTTPEREKAEIEEDISPEAKDMVIDIAKQTGREFSF